MPDTESRPHVRMCPDCRDGKHHNCAGVAFNDRDEQVPCPCHKCHPPKPQTCTACGGHISPYTGECRCSD